MAKKRQATQEELLTVVNDYIADDTEFDGPVAWDLAGAKRAAVFLRESGLSTRLTYYGSSPISPARVKFGSAESVNTEDPVRTIFEYLAEKAEQAKKKVAAKAKKSDALVNSTASSTKKATDA
jgi:hypothetical protein